MSIVRIGFYIGVCFCFICGFLLTGYGLTIDNTLIFTLGGVNLILLVVIISVFLDASYKKLDIWK